MPLAVGQGTLPDWISVLLAVLTAAAGGLGAPCEQKES